MNTLPTIPKTEYSERWTKVRKMMDEQGLDALIAYSDDHATYGNALVRWLCNLQTHFEPACVLMFKSGDPILLVGPESVGYANLHSVIADIRCLKEFTHPDEDYPFATLTPLIDIVAQHTDVSSIKRVGIGAKDLMSYETYTSFGKVLSSAELVDCSAELNKLRAVKSKAEIEVIKYAYHLAQLGIDAALSVIKPGVYEREIAAAAEYAMRKAGSEGMGIDTIVASNKNTKPILARTLMHKVEANDAVILTFAPRYEGYHGAIGRTVTVGDPGETYVKALNAAVAAQKICYENLKPGIVGSTVEGLGRKVVADAGFGEYFLYSGLHSVGVIEFEPPICGPSSRDVLAPGMVLSVDIPMFEANFGGLRIEDGYVITESGCEKLNHTPYLIEK